VGADPPDCPVGVGWTTGAGLPVDPTNPPRRVERSSAGADEAGVGWTTGAGPPVDPTNPPRSVDRSSAGADEAGVGWTTGAGLPVDAEPPDCPVGVGWTTGAGPPVDPTSPPRSVERSSAGADEAGVGCTTGEEMSLEGPADEPAEGAGIGLGPDEVAGTITLGSRPVEPRIGSKGLFASDPEVDDCAGVGSAFCSGEEVGCTMTAGTPDDEAPRAGLEGTSCGASLLGASGVAIVSDLRSVDPPLELDLSSGVEGTGAGDARWDPVPD
jgi:hypothetical protein